MRFEEPVPVTTIAQLIGADIEGKKDRYATGINEIHKVDKGDLVFVDHPKYYATCINSEASFIIIDKRTDYPENKTLLIVPDPFEAYLKIVNHYRPFSPSHQMVSDTAKIGEGTIIMPGTFIGNHVTIGAHCIIHPHVTILDHCMIGDRVIIQAGTVVGSDAFYYNKKTNKLLYNVSLPFTSGFPSMLQNIGAVRNQGIEFALNTINIDTKKLRWSTTFNFSHNVNKILSLGPVSYQYTGNVSTSLFPSGGQASAILQVGKKRKKRKS